MNRSDRLRLGTINIEDEEKKEEYLLTMTR